MCGQDGHGGHRSRQRQVEQRGDVGVGVRGGGRDCRGGGGIWNNAEADSRGTGGKRHGNQSRGRRIWRRRHIGHDHCGSRRRGSGGPIWGVKSGKGEGCWTEGKPGRQVLYSGNKRGGTQGLRSGIKLQGGLPGSGRGSQVAKGKRHPQSGRFSLGVQNLRSDPRGRQSAEVDIQGRGGEGKETTQPSKTPRGAATSSAERRW